MTAIENVQQDQADLKEHILNKIEAQDRKLELSLTSGKQPAQPQNNQNEVRQCVHTSVTSCCF